MNHQNVLDQSASPTVSSRPLPLRLVSLFLWVLCIGGKGLAVTDRYVDRNSPTPSPPYLTWSTAAPNIQDAVDFAEIGDTVWVTNGIYDSGGMAGYPSGSALPNRVTIHRPITVRAVSTNPADTVISGHGPIGNSAVRCVYMADGATLMGFTITNGATLSHGDLATERSGGGIWAAGTNAIVANCVITGNSADRGGGVSGATLWNCRVEGNWAPNDRDGVGGGASGSVLYNCSVTGNWASDQGGGATGCFLYNCMLTGNRSASAGGAYGSDLVNCIVYYNAGGNHEDSTLRYCVTVPIPEGDGNVDTPPLFVNAGTGFGLDHVHGDYRLLSGSPCIEGSASTGPAVEQRGSSLKSAKT